jgi:hypothetical protein
MGDAFHKKELDRARVGLPSWDYRITGLQDYRITGLQDYRITGLQDYEARKVITR